MIDYKEIHWDTVITEFGYKDEALHIHFHAGPKLKKDFKTIDVVLDPIIKDTFHKDILATGEIIQTELDKLKKNDIVYSSDPAETIKWQSGRSRMYKPGLPTTTPQEFKETELLYQELMKLYEEESVIHKSYVDSMNGVDWGDLRSWSYIVYYKTPFIDTIMVEMCKKINEKLI